MALSASSAGGLAGADSLNPPRQSVPGPTLSVVSTSPPDSAVLDSSPAGLSVTFDRPVDPFSVNEGDFQIVRVAPDGSTSPLKPVEARVSEALDPADPAGRRIALTLSQGLTRGHYRLLLDPRSQLQGLDGSSLARAGSAAVLSDFSFSPPEAGPGSATNLQALGPGETVAAGRLDLADDPGAVQYYQFSLAPGHHWLVGLEISSHRDGGTLDSSLSLFDSRGHLISTRNQGMPGNPDDPYLFQGLDAGTYYVGVSARKNVPDASGAYAPSGAKLDAGAAGGPFRLHLVADPADQPTRLLGLQLDHADPLSASPTGLTLQFSGALDPSRFQGPGRPALALVDQSGKSWSLSPMHYDSGRAQLALAFDRALPAGSYAIEVANLVDLSGRPPSADGLPAGDLGSFVVAPSEPARGDLGPLYPGAPSGLSATVQVGPGRPVTLPFVVLDSGLHAIEGVGPGSGVGFTIQDGSGNVLAAGPGASPGGSNDFSLAAGAYRLVLSTASPQASAVTITIRRKQALLDSLLDSGVAQGPALSLRLVTPQADFGQGGAASAGQLPSGAAQAPPPGSPSSPSDGPGGGRAAGLGATVAVGLATPANSSAAVLVYGGGPMGRIAWPSSSIGVVGPAGSSGLAALASNGEGLPGGLMAVPVAIGGGGLEPDAPPMEGEVVKPASAPSSKAGITLEAGLLARAPGSRREDDRTLADADWIGRLVARAMDWLEATPADEVAAVADSAPSGVAPPAVPSEAPVEEPRVEAASLTSPLGIGIALGMLAYRYRKVLGGLPTRAKPSPKSGHRAILAGPHRRSKVLAR